MVNQLLKIFRKSKFVLYVQVLDKIFFFVLFLALARVLSVNEYGDIVLIFSISNILLYVMQYGLPVFFQRQTAKADYVDKSHLNVAIIYGTVSFIISTLLLLLIVGIFYGYSRYSLALLVHSFVFSYFFISIFNSFLLGKGEQCIQFLSYLVSRILSIVLISVFLYYLAGIFLFLTIGFVGNAAIAIMFYLYLISKHTDKNKNSKISFASFKYIFVMSLPIGIAAISNFLYDKIDVILISKVINIEQVAYYNVSYGVFKASQLLFSFILVTGFTRVSSLSGRKTAVRIFFQKYFKYLLIIGIATLVFLVIFSKIIILYIYGEKYLPSVILLQLLSLSIIPVALNNLTGITMNGLGMYKENLTVVLSALFINVLLNIILLNSIGILGAVYSTLITEVFILVYDLYFLKMKLW